LGLRPFWKGPKFHPKFHPKFMGAIAFFFLLFQRSHIDWHITNVFGNIGSSPIEAPFWTPVTK
jgi:hypothetical protein